MAPADRRHLDDVTAEQLHAIALGENAGARHVQILVHGESPSHRVHAHGAPPRGEASRICSSMSAPRIRYIESVREAGAPRPRPPAPSFRGAPKQGNSTTPRPGQTPPSPPLSPP